MAAAPPGMAVVVVDVIPPVHRRLAGAGGWCPARACQLLSLLGGRWPASSPLAPRSRPFPSLPAPNVLSFLDGRRLPPLLRQPPPHRAVIPSDRGSAGAQRSSRPPPPCARGVRPRAASAARLRQPTHTGAGRGDGASVVDRGASIVTARHGRAGGADGCGGVECGAVGWGDVERRGGWAKGRGGAAGRFPRHGRH